MRKQFVVTSSELALADDKVVIVLGDISHFQFMGLQKRFEQENKPQRVHNLGICENAILSMGAGLGAQGMFPFLHTINPFLTERCVEQIKIDLCYNQFGANIVTTGASFDYAWDGATHHCYTELAILRMLPGMEVTQPGNAEGQTDVVGQQGSQHNTIVITLNSAAAGYNMLSQRTADVAPSSKRTVVQEHSVRAHYPSRGRRPRPRRNGRPLTLDNHVTDSSARDRRLRDSSCRARRLRS